VKLTSRVEPLHIVTFELTLSELSQLNKLLARCETSRLDRKSSLVQFKNQFMKYTLTKEAQLREDAINA
jgi:hypothetical protein